MQNPNLSKSQHKNVIHWRVGPRCCKIMNFTKGEASSDYSNPMSISGIFIGKVWIYFEKKANSFVTGPKTEHLWTKRVKRIKTNSPQQKLYLLPIDNYFLFGVDAFSTYTSFPYVIFIHFVVSSCISRVTSCLWPLHSAVTTGLRRLADNFAPWWLCHVRLAGKRPWA